MNRREQLLEVIKGGESVIMVVEGIHKQFTMANINEFPPMEYFIEDTPEAKEKALAELRKEKEELEARLASLGEPTEAPKKAEKVEPVEESKPITEEIVMETLEAKSEEEDKPAKKSK